MHRVITHWILIATSVLVTACGPEVLYERSIATGADEEQPSWAYTDSLAYEFDVPSTDQRYDLELLVEHAEAFPYENFYLNLHTTPPNGKRTTERVSLQLSGEYGEWHGACSGGDCELGYYAVGTDAVRSIRTL